MLITEEKRRELSRSPSYIAFISALVTGVIVHLFALTNVLHNYDDIYMQPGGYGCGLTSGRWLLQIIGDAAAHWGFTYNLPLIHGLFFLFTLALSTALTVSVLKIRNISFSVLTGMIFVVFPTCASTMFFRYTAPFYGIGIICAVLAAWILGRFRGSFLLSALFTAMSLGIYQSYTPLTIGIFIMVLLRDVLSTDVHWRDFFRRGLLYCCSLLLGLVFYFIILKLMLITRNVELLPYQGISSMGTYSLSSLPSLVLAALRALPQLPFKDYCHLADTPFIRSLYLFTGIFSFLTILILLVTQVKRISTSIFAFLLLILFPLSVNFIVIMCPNSTIYTLMVYGFVLVPLLPLTLAECLLPGTCVQRLAKASATLLLSAFVFFYSYDINLNYTALHYANEQTRNYFVSLVTQVRMTEGFRADQQWAMIGKNQDPLLFSPWSHFSRYGGNTTAMGLINAGDITTAHWLYNYIGYSVTFTDNDTIHALSQTAAVKSMPCWPDEGSIQIVDNTVVIKFQELS